MSSVFEGAALLWWQWTAAMSVQLVFVVLVIAGLDRRLRPWIWPQLRAALWMLVVVKRGQELFVKEIFDRWDLHSAIIGEVTDDGMVRVMDGESSPRMPTFGQSGLMKMPEGGHSRGSLY